jgi:hypothetical protein
MSAPSFDLDVDLPRRKKVASEDVSWLDLELDVRPVGRPIVIPPGDFQPRPMAGSLTCGNTCGVLSIGCGGSGCGGVTCSCTCGCTDGCTDGCDFTNGCDF